MLNYCSISPLRVYTADETALKQVSFSLINKKTEADFRQGWLVAMALT